MVTDIEIATKTRMRTIDKIAKDLRIKNRLKSLN